MVSILNSCIFEQEEWCEYNGNRPKGIDTINTDTVRKQEYDLLTETKIPCTSKSGETELTHQISHTGRGAYGRDQLSKTAIDTRILTIIIHWLHLAMDALIHPSPNLIKTMLIKAAPTQRRTKSQPPSHSHLLHRGEV